MLANLMIAIKKWNRFLSNESDSSQREFNSQSLLVNGFQIAGAKLAMNGNGRSDDRVGNSRVPQFFSCVPAFLSHFRSFQQLPLFPNRDRAPWAQSGLFLLRSVLPG